MQNKFPCSCNGIALDDYTYNRSMTAGILTSQRKAHVIRDTAKPQSPRNFKIKGPQNHNRCRGRCITSQRECPTRCPLIAGMSCLCTFPMYTVKQPQTLQLENAQWLLRCPSDPWESAAPFSMVDGGTLGQQTWNWVPDWSECLCWWLCSGLGFTTAPVGHSGV